MYATIRHGKIKPGKVEQVAQRVQEGFVPLSRRIPGFVAYYSVVTDANELLTISIFEDEAGVEQSNRQVTEWAEENIADLLQGRVELAPENKMGRVVALHEEA